MIIDTAAIGRLYYKYASTNERYELIRKGDWTL